MTVFKSLRYTSLLSKHYFREFWKLPPSGRWFSNRTNGEITEKFVKVMRRVPQPVIVVTSAVYHTDTNYWHKRGVTCSSFNSISLLPPVVSFAVTRKSRMHGVLLDADRFAIHVLAQNQVAYGVHFSKPAEDGKDQFENIPHEMDEQGIPIIRDTNAVIVCQTHSIHTIGDHHVWYGEVLHAYDNTVVPEPLLYFARSFHSIGDQAFIKAFEEATLPFVDWTHEAHIRMAWNYITELGPVEAVPCIKNGIKKYNERNKDKISRGYHETVTMFYIRIVAAAIKKNNANDVSFMDFIERNQYLLDRNLLFMYYSDELINKPEAKTEFLPPDKKSLPG